VRPLRGSVAESFRTHAHRFSVIVATSLDSEQRAVVERILQVHRPAHTIFDLCSVDAGMRVGLGLLVGLSSAVGGSGNFTRAQVGAWSLGRDAVLGKPGTGTSVGNTRLGQGSRVGG